MVSVAQKIGWIGTGVMGKHMAGHVMKKGNTIGVFNRTASKCDELVKDGAIFKSPQELAAESDILILMLAYP
jgi:3-hydroxyisobutyrate dehydrogenase